MNGNNYPGIVISGLSGDSGKTVVSCGLLACLKERGTNIYAFKKGPDYIDAAWLSLASGKPARNLDTPHGYAASSQPLICLNKFSLLILSYKNPTNKSVCVQESVV